MTEVSARLTKVEYARVWLVKYRMSIGGIGTAMKLLYLFLGPFQSSHEAKEIIMLKKQAKGNQTQSVEEIFGLSREGSRILLLILTP